MKQELYIEHNPFLVETKICISGETNNLSLPDKFYKNRMQVWIDDLFPQLQEQFNGASNFDITFKGVKADFLDLEDAANRAKNESCMNISLTHIDVVDSVKRLDMIANLMVEAVKNPLFKDKLQSGTIKRNFDEAVNKDFDVYVAATMSAGKSTFVNAMLGTELLPAANEATTATIAKIYDCEKGKETPIGEFTGFRVNKQNQIVDEKQSVDLEILTKWNKEEDTKIIELSGNIVGITKRDDVRLVITDTPGPNNSQDPEHSITTMSYIQDSMRNPLILYILNTTQLATDDDKKVLNQIADIMKKGGKQSRDRFIFVLNKIDEIDPDTGETLQNTLDRTTKYLKGHGIEYPCIYPISAHAAYLARKDPNKLTKKEKLKYEYYKSIFEDEKMDLIKKMPLSNIAQEQLQNRQLDELLKRSGVPAIEVMIDEYIDKYSLPERVNRAYIALNKAIEISYNEQSLIEKLDKSNKEKDELLNQIGSLKNNKKNKVKASAKMRTIVKDKRSIYDLQSLDKIRYEETEIRKLLNKFQDNFKGKKFTVREAELAIQEVKDEFLFQQNILINKLEGIINNSKEYTTNQLRKIFKQYVKDLFDKKNIDIPTPMIDSLKTQVESISDMTDLGLNDDEIEEIEYEEKYTTTEKKKVVVGWRWAPKFWHISTWLDTEDVYEYRDELITKTRKKKEEYVDGGNIWKNRKCAIDHAINELCNSAYTKIMEDSEKYGEDFVKFIDRRFEKELRKITDNIESKYSNTETLENEIKIASKKLNEIKTFKNKVEELVKL